MKQIWQKLTKTFLRVSRSLILDWVDYKNYTAGTKPTFYLKYGQIQGFLKKMLVKSQILQEKVTISSKLSKTLKY